MRIGLISYAYPPQPDAGGVASYTWRLAGALGRAGHDVHVIASPANAPEWDQPRVQVHRVAANGEIRSDSRAVRWAYWHTLAPLLERGDRLVWHLIKWNLATRDVLESIDREQPLDLIEAPEFAANGWVAGQLGRWPLVVRVHCPWELYHRLNHHSMHAMNRLLATLERMTIQRYASAVTVPSYAMKKSLEQLWGLDLDPHIVPNFMDIPAEPAPLIQNEPARIVCVGRIEPLKGQDTLVRAFASVAAQHPQAELWLIGPDQWSASQSFESWVNQAVPDPSIRSRIHMPGFLPLCEVQRHLRGARVTVVSTSGFESFCNTALEAMAAARPLVATHVGALPELVDHEETGLLVPPEDPSAMAQAIDRLLRDHDLSNRCRLAAHSTAISRFDTRNVIPRVLNVYSAALRKHRALAEAW